MAVTVMNHLPENGFFFMRQALVEARLMSDKRACDAVYVATLAEKLRNIEKNIAATMFYRPARNGLTRCMSRRLESRVCYGADIGINGMSKTMLLLLPTGNISPSRSSRGTATSGSLITFNKRPTGCP
jgi:hypothetical protein